MKTISILGCGWLGTPLACRLLQAGMRVKGSTTRAEKVTSLKDLGIKPFLLQLTPRINGQSAAEFFQTDVLVLDLPPQVQAKGPDYHLQQIEAILQQLPHAELPNVLYTSSTSVYPSSGTNLTEESTNDQASGTNQTLLQAEKLLRESLGKRLSILRCGGLMGYDRISGKWSQGKALEDGPVNYLHRDDAVEIILQLILQEKWGNIYNAVAPQHPNRAVLYQKNAEAFGWPPAHILPTTTDKTISSQKLTDELGYEFIFPDPLAFFYTRPTKS